MAVNYTPSLSSGLGPSPVKKSDMQAWLNEISSGIASLDPRATPIYASRASAVSAAPGLPASLTHIMVREGTALVIRSRTASADDPLFTSGAQWGVVMRQDVGAILTQLAIKLDSVAGTTTAFTASIPANILALGQGDVAEGQEISFTPVASNTSTNPTLRVDRGGTVGVVRGIRDVDGETWPEAAFVVGRPYTLRRVGTLYRVIAGERRSIAGGQGEAESSDGIMETWPAATLCTRMGKRNWRAQETPGEVDDALWSRSELIPVKQGECYRITLPIDVTTTGRHNYVAFYDTPNAPIGSLAYVSRNDVSPTGYQKRFLENQAPASRRGKHYFRVPRDGFIAVECENAIKGSVRLQSITFEKYVEDHWYLDAPAIFNQFRNLGVYNYTPILTTFGETYLTGASTDLVPSGNGTLSEFVPVKAGEYVHAFTTVGVNSVSVALFDTSKNLLSVRGPTNTHESSLQYLNDSGRGSFTMAENVPVTQDGFVRVINLAQSYFPADSTWLGITKGFLKYDRGYFRNEKPVRRLKRSSFVVGSTLVQINSDSAYDILGPIHIAKGDILRIKTTEVVGASINIPAIMHSSEFYNGQNAPVFKVPYFGQFFEGSSLPTEARETVRYVCADDFELTIFVMTAAGTGGVEQISEDEFVAERAAILSSLRPTWRNSASGIYGTHGTSHSDKAGMGFVPVRKGEVLRLKSNGFYLNNPVLGVPTDINGDELAQTISILLGVTLKQPENIAYRAFSQNGYVGWTIFVDSQAEANAFYDGETPRVLSRQEYIDRLHAGEVELGIAKTGSVNESQWDADSNYVLRPPSIRSVPNGNMGMPFFVPKGECVEYYGNVSGNDGVAAFPLYKVGKTTRPLWPGPSTGGGIIPQPVHGWLKAEQDMYVLLNTFNPLSMDFSAVGNHNYLINEQRGLWIKSVTEEEYYKNKTLSEVKCLVIPDPHGIELHLVEGLSPNAANDGSGGAPGLVQIKQGGAILAVFRCKTERQGQGSVQNLTIKRNWDWKFYNAFGERVSLKIGDWKETEKIIIKGYDRDMTKARDTIATKVWRSVRRARPYPKNLIWDERLLEQKDTFKLIEKQTDAVLSTQGTPCTLYIGGFNMGLYVLRNKKDNPNYAMNKSNPDHILIESDFLIGKPGGGFIRWQDFNWAQWEVRHPKISGYDPGDVVTGDLGTKIERFFIWVHGCLDGSIDFLSTYQDYINVESFIDSFIVFNYIAHRDGINNNTLLATWDGIHWTATIYDVDRTFLGVRDDIVGKSDGPWKLVWNNLKPQLNARYAELRNSGVLSEKALFKLVDEFNRAVPDSWLDQERKIFNTSREEDNWIYPGLGALYLVEWANERLAYLDGQFSYTP